MLLLGLTRAEAESHVRPAGAASAGHDTPLRVEVLAACMDAVRLFAALAGQWRMALTAVPTPAGPAMVSTRIAIDLAAAEAGARWLGLALSPRLLRDLQIMEAEALATDEERRR